MRKPISHDRQRFNLMVLIFIGWILLGLALNEVSPVDPNGWTPPYKGA